MQFAPNRPAGRTLALAVPSLALLATAVMARSSHREAPFVAGNPQIDATDFYMFRSYEPGRQDFVTLVANYLPLQDPYGGPNYFALDPNAMYAIHIDNNGDAVEDITLAFRPQLRLRDIQLPVGPPGSEVNVSVALKNVAPITAADNSALNELEQYSLSYIEGPVSAPTSSQLIQDTSGATAFTKPVDNIGTKSIADYDAYASSFIYDIELPDGQIGRMFVGQRKDPFVVNLGETFDLINTNPVGAPDGREDSLADKNITSFILELPKSFVHGNGGSNVLGAWTTAWLPRTRTLESEPTFTTPVTTSGTRQQVSRLSMPLVNEVVIGLKDKNRFNSSRPLDDGQFIDYVTNPTLPELIEILFGVTAPELFPRSDLVATFLTGFSGLNDNGSVGEMLRLNTDIPVTPAGSQSRLGVLENDLAGFPNGRRPGDDVVDITLRVAMGAILPPALAPDGQLPYTDGAIVDDSFFDSAFPYLRTPLPGAPQ